MWKIQCVASVQNNQGLTRFYMYFWVDSAFVVKYEVTAKILQTNKDIGPLIDRIGKHKGTLIMNVDWKDAEVQLWLERKKTKR